MKYFFIACTLLASTGIGFGQVSVNPFGFPADPSAVLDLSYDAESPKGILIPRMDISDALSIPSPASGLMVYDTSSNRFLYYNGFQWNWVGEGYWIESGVGIHSTPEHVGIGTFADIDYGLTVNHPALTGISAHSGFAAPALAPVIPSAFVGYGTGGNHGAQFYADSSGTGLIAGVSGSGFAARLLGGDVYVEESLGIGVENPSSPLVVSGEVDAIASFRSTANTMIELRKDGFQRGFMQIFENGENDDFYVGKTIGQGFGDVHLYNQGRSFAVRNSGAFRFSQPTGGTNSMLIEMRRNGDQHGFIQIYDDVFNGIPNVMKIGKPGSTGDLRIENGDRYIVFEPDGDVGIGTNSGLTFPPVANRLRVESEKTTPAFSSNVTFNGNSDVRAIEGISVPADGYGFGGWFKGGYYGLFSEAVGGSYTGNAYGVLAKASGTAGTRYGLHASATGGDTNWAGYFAQGNVFITNGLRIGNQQGAGGYALSVDGKIIGEELKIQDSGAWPDYVFEESYDLMPLNELERSIKANKHLPGIPSAQEVSENGILVGEMQKKMMEKIEELTLYIIAMEKRIAEIENQ